MNSCNKKAEEVIVRVDIDREIPEPCPSRPVLHFTGNILWAFEEWLHDAIKRHKAKRSSPKNTCKLAKLKKSFSLRKTGKENINVSDSKDYYQKLLKDEERFVSKYVDKE